MKISTNTPTRSRTKMAPPASKREQTPTDSVTLGSDTGTKVKIGLTVVATVAGVAGGLVLGSKGGVVGALASAPGALALAAGGFALGGISDGANGGGNDKLKVMALGGAAGALLVGAGALGGVVGGVASAAGLGLVGLTTPGMLPG